jgi:hypothetical protein
MMYVSIPKEGYWLSSAEIEKIQQLKNATYMGYWAVRTKTGSWSDEPVDVFYTPNPDTGKGHTNYFGMLVQNSVLYITEASSAFSEPIAGMPTPDGEVLVSRYRHDYVTKGDRMIDGGRDYIRASMHATVAITVADGEFVISQKLD